MSEKIHQCIDKELNLFRDEEQTLDETRQKILTLFSLEDFKSSKVGVKRRGCCQEILIRPIVSCVRSILLIIKYVVVSICSIGVIVFIIGLALKMYPIFF
jgi:hypothetical protein